MLSQMSVCPPGEGVGCVCVADTRWADAPRQPPPRDQTPQAGTPRTRYSSRPDTPSPWDQTPPPSGTSHLQADIPPGPDTSPRKRHPPGQIPAWNQTSPGTRHPPGRHPPGPNTRSMHLTGMHSCCTFYLFF